MSLDTETILDRRRVRRQLSFWRVLAVISLTLAAGALLVSSESGLLDRRQIARVSLEGMITESRDLLKLLDRVGLIAVFGGGVAEAHRLRQQSRRNDDRR